MFLKEVFVVYLDENFVEITEEEDYIWDLVQDHVNGTPYPLTDDNFCDRVFWHKIETGRYYIDGQTIRDKLSDKNIFCGTQTDAEYGVKQMNELQLEKERAEAKLRAMTL